MRNHISVRSRQGKWGSRGLAAFLSILMVWSSVPWPAFAVEQYRVVHSQTGSVPHSVNAAPIHQWAPATWEHLAQGVDLVLNDLPPLSEGQTVSPEMVVAALKPVIEGPDPQKAAAARFVLFHLASPGAEAASQAKGEHPDALVGEHALAFDRLDAYGRQSSASGALKSFREAAQKQGIRVAPDSLFDGRQTRYRLDDLVITEGQAGALAEGISSSRSPNKRFYILGLLKRIGGKKKGARTAADGLKEDVLDKLGAEIQAVQGKGNPGASGKDEAEASLVGSFMMRVHVLVTSLALMAVEWMNSGSMPVYLDKAFHRKDLMADLSVLVMLANVVGTQLSPIIINRYGLKASYLGLLGVSFLAAISIGYFASSGIMTLPLLFGLVLTYRTLQSASLNAEMTVVPVVLESQNEMEMVRGRKLAQNSVASAVVQNVAGALVAWRSGATLNMVLAPWLYIAAILLTWWTLKIPQDGKAATRGIRVGGRSGGALRDLLGNLAHFGQQIVRGYKVVMHDEVLRTTTLASALLTTFKWLTFFLFPQLFAAYVIGDQADLSQGGPIMGLIVGLFSFGGFFAGRFVVRSAAAIQSRFGKDDAARDEASRASTVRWLKFSALSFLLLAVMASPLPVIGPLLSLNALASSVAGLLHISAASVPARMLLTGVLGLGMTLALWRPLLGLAIALLPLALSFPSHVVLVSLAFFVAGFIQNVGTTKRDSYFNAVVKRRIADHAGDDLAAQNDMASTQAFVTAYSIFFGMVALMLMKYLFYGKLPFDALLGNLPFGLSTLLSFAGLPGLAGFVVLTGLAGLTAIKFYRIVQKLDRLTRPGQK